MSCLCSLAPLPGPLSEPRLGTASAPRSATAKPALAQQKGQGLVQDVPRQLCFLPFLLLHDSWNVFAHGGKNAKSREKQPGTSPSLPPSPPSLSCGAGRHGGSRQHRYPGKSEEPPMPVAGETPRDEMNFWGNPFRNEKRKIYCLHKLS